MNNQELSSLIHALIDGEITEKQRQALDNQMMTSPVVSEELHELMVVDDLLKQESAEFGALGAEFTASVGAKMSSSIASQASRALWFRRITTGVGLAGAGLGLWFLLQSPQDPSLQFDQSQVSQRQLQSTLPYAQAPQRTTSPVEVVELLEAEDIIVLQDPAEASPNGIIQGELQVEGAQVNAQLTVLNSKISAAAATGNEGDVAYWMTRRAELHLQSGALELAQLDISKALVLAREHSFPQTEINALGLSSELYHAQGNTSAAKEFADRCIAKAEEGKYTDLRRKWSQKLNR